MNTSKQVVTQAHQIADEIVKLVERVDGPVTLAQVEREIAGFSKKEPPSWERLAGEVVIWNQMTAAGDQALREVLYERRVAIQSVSPLLYLLEGCFVSDPAWWPIVLLPAKAANLESPTFLIRATSGYQDFCMAKAAAESKTGYRLLKPGSVRCTADRFAVA